VRSTLGKYFVPSLVTLALGFLMAMPAVSVAAQPTVNLGTTSTFAVLAGTTITNIGSTVINGSAGGDIGVSAGSAITGFPPGSLTGTKHSNDAAAIQAQTDLVTAYDDAAGRTPVTRISTELGGKTLKPGVYDSASGTFHITGTLTLDAEGDPNAVFVFKTVSTLITASDSRVSLVNGARYCRIFWKVGSSATLGTTARFVGHIFALTSITVNTGATVQGQLLARNGAVTLHANTITNGLCEAVQGPIIFVTKSASPLTVAPGGSVTYTYLVTNPGTVDLSGVTLVDDKVSTVTYVSGDVNGDGLLQPGETWVYTATTTLQATTTNTATATGSGAEQTVTASAVARVVVRTGGVELPKTSTPWYNLLLVGAVLAFVGAVSLFATTRKTHA
jgi:uncharacterized repeat protein (TIGR01451 family)